MHCKRLLHILIFTLALACLPMTALGENLQQPKVDNFLFVADTSGSMGQSYLDSGNSKAMTAKELMGRLNQAIPNLDYQSGLYTAAPSKQVAPWALYRTTRYAQAIANVPDTVRKLGFIGYPTPLADGLNNLAPALDTAEGSTAIILFSDGQANTGGNPVQAAQALYEAYPQICIHTVSLANSGSGQATLDAIANLRDCSVSTTAAALDAPAALNAFVQRVFYTQLKDSDGDGVLDSKDQCPGTPQGVSVDERGCAIDSDGDGVIDAKDECPGTPQGVAVDSKGCPLDSDGDGVIDAKDECPGTPQGVQVDEKGCPVPMDVSISILFDIDKSVVRGDYHDELADAAAMLNKNPEANAVIEGHTDSTASAAYNMELSKKRAQSVRDYLVDTFDIDPQRLSTKAYGESQPTATNTTRFGRKLNRRVVITLQ